MNRTGWYKALYFGIVITLSVGFVAAYFCFHLTPIQVIALVALLFLPGKILGYFWRDLLRGLRLLQEKRYGESKQCSLAFLADVAARPWLKKLIWLGFGAYSRDAEALALNNLGAAEIKLGEAGAAREHLNLAIALDRQCPLPYFNLGVLSLSEDDSTAAQQWFEQAKRLGFSRSKIDRIMTASQTRFANREGK